LFYLLKVFIVATSNNPPNDRIYVPAVSRKRHIADMLDLPHVSDGVHSPWMCPKCDKLTWYLSILHWRSMVHTTVRCFWLKSYCWLCMRSKESSLSSRKTMALFTEREKLSTFWHQHTPAFTASHQTTDLNQLTIKFGEKCSSWSTK